MVSKGEMLVFDLNCITQWESQIKTDSIINASHIHLKANKRCANHDQESEYENYHSLFQSFTKIKCCKESFSEKLETARDGAGF